MMFTAMMVSCCSSSLVSWEIDGPKETPVERAEKYLVDNGYVKRRTKIKRLSAKTIARIINELQDARIINELQYAETWRDNHECEPYYHDY